MPVGNQWKAKAKEEAAAKAAAAAAPVEAPPAVTSAGDQGKKVGGSRFRSKGAAEAKQPEAPPAPPVKEAADEGPAGRSNKSVNAGKWTASQDEQKVIRKKRLEVTEADVDGNADRVISDPANVGIILENEPIRLEGVVRSDDPSEFQKPLELEKGWAKNLASRFQQQNNDSDERRSFKLDVEIGAEAEIHENEPTVLEGVVRSTDRTEDVIGKRGTIKNIAGRFASGQATGDGDRNGDNSSTSRERSTAPRRSVLERFERGPIDSDGSVVLSENVPEQLDPNVVRSTDGYRANDPVMKAGRTKNMADRFRSQKPISDDDEESGDERPAKPSKPAWLVELEKAKEAETRVVENEPEVRDDVVRADDDTPDIISVQHTRSLRQMWTQIEKEKEAAERQPKNRPLPPVAKPKEPSPEPEPPKPPPEEPKPTSRFASRRTVGRLQMGQLQKDEPPATVPDTSAGRGKQSAVGVTGKQTGVVGSRQQQQQQQQQQQPAQQPLEVETKASKFNVRPNLKSVNPVRK